MALTAGSPFIGVQIETNVSGEATLSVLKTAITDGLRQVFEGNILSDAKATCPVGTDPIEPGSTRNRDSLDVVVWTSPRGPMGKLFSQSGHGGFVEVGTVHMSAQPYAWPALQTNIPTIMTAIKDNLSNLEVPKGEPVQLGRTIM
jgi:hypothetical protein